MNVELLNPAGLYQPPHYAQLAVARGSRTLYLSGQLAVDATGALVGAGDLAAQTTQAYLNVVAALAAAGATMDDVARLTVYLPGWSPDKLPQLAAGIGAAARQAGFQPRRTMTLIGVAALSAPEYLIEVEATAVLA